MLQKRAKTNLRKLRAVSLIRSVPVLLLAAGLAVLLFRQVLTPIPGLLLYVVLSLVWILLTRRILMRAQNTYIFNVLNEEMNIPLFLEITRLAGKRDPYGGWQLQALYAEGRYADLVSFCAKQISNPFAKRMRLVYFTYLENAYFQLGDDEKLRAAYEAAERLLRSFKNYGQVRGKMPLQTFFEAYLAGDADGCEAYMQRNPPRSRIAAKGRYLMTARLAQRRGDREEARRLLTQALTEAPDTPVAVSAQAHLAALERGEDYTTAFPEVLPDPLYPVVTTEKRYKTRRVIQWVIAGILLLAVLVSELTVLHSDREYEAICEDARVAMEETYDGVAVLGCFTVSDGESWLDSMAICTTEQGFVMAALYYYDDPDETLCDPLVTLTEADFAGNSHPYRVFRGCTEDYYGACTFFDSEERIPKDAYVSFPVTVYGRELWFAVVYVGTEPPESFV